MLTVGNSMISGPASISAYWEWDEDSGPDQICLAGLAAPAMLNAPYVAIMAEKDSSGWIPTWRLRLQTNWRLNGKTGDILLSSASFSRSDRIKTSLSYHPNAQVLSIAISNQSTNTQLYTNAFKVNAQNDAVIPVVSTSVPGSPILQEMQVQDGYTPFADRIEIGEHQPNGDFIPLTTFDGSGDAAIRITSPVSSPGEYHAVLKFNTGSSAADANYIELARISATKTENWVEIPLQQLPRGPVSLVVDYIDGGKILSSNTSKLTIGKASLSYDLTKVDRSDGTVEGTVGVSSPTSLEGVSVEVRAQYSQLNWDPDSLSYKETLWSEEPLVVNQPIESLCGAAPYVFTVPMPAAVGIWKVMLKESTSPQISSFISGTAEYFNNTPAPQDNWIAITDLATTQVRVFDPQIKDWATPGALKWSWEPSKALGYNVYEISQWSGPSDVKLRNSVIWGGQWIVTTAGGLATIAAYPSGTKKWAEVVGSRDNMHSIELLPNGNVAIAASTGGWVRVYASSQGESSSMYTQYDLQGAHSVLWDPKLDLLWAVGDYILVGFQVKGTDSQPKLEKAVETRIPSNWGHDLSPVYGDSDRLWVTTGSAVYQYIKSAGIWLTAYPGGGMISRDNVKSVGNQPSGQVVEARPKPGTLREWTTDTVDVFTPRETRTIQGSSFYKARIWCSDYQ